MNGRGLKPMLIFAEMNSYLWVTVQERGYRIDDNKKLQNTTMNLRLPMAAIV